MRVLVVDDQTLVREGLVILLERMHEVEVVGAVGDGAAAIAHTATRRPDIVLLDVRMPGLDGIQVLRRIRRDFPQVRVLILTTYADDATVLTALRGGANGFLTKDATPAEIHHALIAVSAGHTALEPRVQTALTAAVLNSAAASRQPSHREASRLTARETEILVLVADGLSNHAIATTLGIAVATVKTHLNNLFGKLGLATRAQAVSYAYQHQLAVSVRDPHHA